MRIHKEGYGSIAFVGIFLILTGIAIAFIFPENILLQGIVALAGFIVFLMVIYFFRVPKRITPPDENAIYSAADGKVVAIEEIFDREYFNDKRIQVSVFMSPLNVHVNFYPISGKIMHCEHKSGSHLPAYKAKSSMENEQSCIVLRHKTNKQDILMRQIAGIMARRIVFFSKKGQEVKQGEQLGIIKFGSRLDLLLPTDATIKVKLGQKLKAGVDVVATFD